jgi:hypothetical protein
MFNPFVLQPSTCTSISLSTRKAFANIPSSIARSKIIQASRLEYPSTHSLARRSLLLSRFYAPSSDTPTLVALAKEFLDLFVDIREALIVKRIKVLLAKCLASGSADSVALIPLFNTTNALDSLYYPAITLFLSSNNNASLLSPIIHLVSLDSQSVVDLLSNPRFQPCLPLLSLDYTHLVDLIADREYKGHEATSLVVCLLHLFKPGEKRAVGLLRRLIEGCEYETIVDGSSCRMFPHLNQKDCPQTD